MLKTNILDKIHLKNACYFKYIGKFYINFKTFNMLIIQYCLTFIQCMKTKNILATLLSASKNQEDLETSKSLSIAQQPLSFLVF